MRKLTNEILYLGTDCETNTPFDLEGNQVFFYGMNNSCSEFKGQRLTIKDGKCEEFPHMTVHSDVSILNTRIDAIMHQYSTNNRQECYHATGSVNNTGGSTSMPKTPKYFKYDSSEYSGSAGTADWRGVNKCHKPTHNIFPSSDGGIFVVWHV
tara:strand:+ start:246 stop:704 length:459 start_codon:yes stop_codon:yes gene_type:complete